MRTNKQWMRILEPLRLGEGFKRRRNGKSDIGEMLQYLRNKKMINQSTNNSNRRERNVEPYTVLKESEKERQLRNNSHRRESNADIQVKGEKGTW